MEVKYRRLTVNRERDIQGFLDLYRTVWGCTFPREIWEWKYLRNPLNDGDGPMIYLAKIGDTLASTGALLPTLTRVKTSKLRTALVKTVQGANSMTHPKFRRQGLFTELYRMQLQDATARGFKLCYEYPNKFTYPGFLKMGMKDIARVNRFFSPLSPRALLAQVLGGRKIPKAIGRMISPPLEFLNNRAIGKAGTAESKLKFRHGEVQAFINPISELRAQEEPFEGIYGTRSREFLKWRFSRPDRDYYIFTLWDNDQLMSYLILYVYETGLGRLGLVKDFFAKEFEPDLTEELLARVARELIAKGYVGLSVSLLDREWPFHVFGLRKGFIKLRPKVHLLVYPLSNEWHDESLTDANHWYLQQADMTPF